MREPYVEGIASRHGPESWRRAREGSPQALTGEHAGQPLSSVITRSGAPTSYCGREGNTMPGDSASRGIGPAESETLSMRGSSVHENREIPEVPVGRPRRPQAGRSGKACGRNPDAYAAGKSDTGIVPMNAGNNAAGRGTAGRGGNVNPPRNRKSGAGNPPPVAEPVPWPSRPRTGGREGR